MVLDGSTPFQGISQASHLAHATAGSGPAAAAAAASAAAPMVVDGGAPTAMDATSSADAGRVEALEGEVAGLQQQLAAAQQLARKWQQAHAELHGVCVQKILKGPLGS